MSAKLIWEPGAVEVEPFEGALEGSQLSEQDLSLKARWRGMADPATRGLSSSAGFVVPCKDMNAHTHTHTYMYLRV